MSDSSPKIGQKKFFYNRVAKALIPAGKQTETGEEIYDNKEWTSMKIKLTENNLIYGEQNKRKCIRVHDIYYLDRRFQHPKAGSPKVLTFNYSTKKGDFLGLIKNRTTRAKEILKKRLLRQIVKDANIWYIRSYQLDRGNNPNKGWNQGIFKIGQDNTLRIEDSDGEIVSTIPSEKVLRLNPITKRKRVNLKIFYEDEGEVQIDLVYSTEIPLDLVTDFFYTDYLDERNTDDIEELSIHEKKSLKTIQKIEERDEREEITLTLDELVSTSEIDEEKIEEILSNLESMNLIKRFKSKILRTFIGVKLTPSEIEEEKDEREKELEKKRKKLDERIKALEDMID